MSTVFAENEKRRVRFENITGLRREDLEAAGEVWLTDLCTAAWVTREAMKLGAYLVNYMAAPDRGRLTLSAIEAQIQIGREEVKFALRLLKLYRGASAYSLEDNEVRIALHLTTAQRLRVLEMRHRLAELMTLRPAERQSNGADWVAPANLYEAPGAEASAKVEAA